MAGSHFGDVNNKRKNGELPSGRLGKTNSLEHNQKIQIGVINFYGSPESSEARQIIKQTSKERWDDPNYSAKMSLILSKPNPKLQGRKRAQWEKDKISIGGKLAYAEGRQTVSDSGRGKGCYHFCKLENKNIWLRSTYEKRFAAWLDANNIEWLYEPKRFKIQSLDTTYCPDFYIPSSNQWYEIKGYWYESAQLKFTAFLEEYPDINIQIIYKEDLERV